MGLWIQIAALFRHNPRLNVVSEGLVAQEQFPSIVGSQKLRWTLSLLDGRRCRQFLPDPWDYDLLAWLGSHTHP